MSDVFLFDTYIAETSYIEGIEKLEPHRNVDDKFNFFHKLDNPHDKKEVKLN